MTENDDNDDNDDNVHPKILNNYHLPLYIVIHDSSMVSVYFIYLDYDMHIQYTH